MTDLLDWLQRHHTTCTLRHTLMLLDKTQSDLKYDVELFISSEEKHISH